DYLVFAIFLVGSALIGFVVGFFDRKNNANSKTFLTGGGKMHWIPVALSMQASFLSAIYILASPVEIYNFGTMYYYIVLTHIVALPLAANLFLATFYKLNLVSAYEV
ncbi:hypothetical protein HELRODRAFT_146890, partial [Helobdella robusta]|uniref:Sodium-dependent multivitamin transporter n=1 Tax=Helobdella robusta TaxID=6412 RepID=T1EJV4_HELRO